MKKYFIIGLFLLGMLAVTPAYSQAPAAAPATYPKIVVFDLARWTMEYHGLRDLQYEFMQKRDAIVKSTGDLKKLEAESQQAIAKMRQDKAKYSQAQILAEEEKQLNRMTTMQNQIKIAQVKLMQYKTSEELRYHKELQEVLAWYSANHVRFDMVVVRNKKLSEVMKEKGSKENQLQAIMQEPILWVNPTNAYLDITGAVLGMINKRYDDHYAKTHNGQVYKDKLKEYEENAIAKANGLGNIK